MDGLPDEAIEVMVDCFKAVPSTFTAIELEQMGGAVARVGAEATAFGHRAAAYNLIVVGNWVDPAENERNVRWVRESWEALRPFVQDSVYVNYVAGVEEERVDTVYGANHGRLAALKAKYDPDNIFRPNQNIPPAG
jgi:hypothetical protein